MSKNVAVVIQEDPRKTHRPVEALRIALGLTAGTHKTTIVLLGDSIHLLSEDNDDIVDRDILEQYLPSCEQLQIPFVLETSANQSLVRSEFTTSYVPDERIRSLVASMDRTIVF